jgi:hypothetical protein
MHRTRHGTPTPLGAVARGVLAGAVGTLAMDLLAFARYRRGGGESGFGEWEFSSGLSSWEDAPGPAQMGKRLIEAFLQRKVPAERAGMVNNAMHWAYGAFWGAQYGIVAGSLRRPRALWQGAAFGALVWASDYVVLPAAKVYKPIWEYDAPTLAKDLSGHVVFGVAADASLRALGG